MKMNIVPFREFWADCYSTAIYSILVSKTSIDKLFVYNNNYQYKKTRIDFDDGNILWSIKSQMDMSHITERVLKNISSINFLEEEEPILVLKSLLYQQKVVFLGVDIYYWIEDNFNWHRNHFNHYSLINGFNEKTGFFYVLETGAKGYKEYEISEKDLLNAMKGFTGKNSMIAEVNNDNTEYASYSKKEFVENARNIINSINEIIEMQDVFLVEDDSVKERYWTVLDHVQIHLYEMESRQRANGLLISNFCVDNNKNIYVNKFDRLEKKYDNLKNLVLKSNVGRKYISLFDLKSEIIKTLEKEKEIWQDIIYNGLIN